MERKKVKRRRESTVREELLTVEGIRRAALLLGAALLFFLLRYTLPVESPEIKLGLAILGTIGFLWFTEALPLAATALLVPVLAIFCGVMPVKESFAGFANPLIFLFLGGFGIAAALSAQGLDRWLAGRLVLAAKGRFVASAVALSGAAAFLSMWISNTAAAAMLLPVALGLRAGLAEKIDDDQLRNASCFLLLGLAFGASIGGIGTPVGTPPNAIAAGQLKMNFAEWMTVGVPAVLVLWPVMMLTLWWTFPVRGLPKVELRKGPEFAWTGERQVTLGVFLLTVLAWLFSGWLAKVLGGVDGLDSVIAIAALVALVCFGLVTWRQIDRGTDWGVLLLFGGGLTLSEMMKAERTGASGWLAGELAELTSSWPELAVVAAMILLVILLTEITSNTATSLIFIPLFFNLSGQMGIEAPKLVIPIALAASCAFMLPVATPPNAIVFGSGKVRQRDMIRVGLRLDFILWPILVAYAVVFL